MQPELPKTEEGQCSYPQPGEMSEGRGDTQVGGVHPAVGTPHGFAHLVPVSPCLICGFCRWSVAPRLGAGEGMRCKMIILQVEVRHKQC